MAVTKSDPMADMKSYVKSKYGKGVTLNPDGDRVILKIGSKKTSLTGLTWTVNDRDTIVAATLLIHDLLATGQHTLASAKNEWLAPLKTAIDSATGVDWPEVVAEFERQTRLKVSDKTWNTSYKLNIDAALLLLTDRDAPTTTFDLIERTQAARGLVNGKKSKNECLNHVHKLVMFAKAKFNLPDSWNELTLDQKAPLRADKWEPEKSMNLSDYKMIELVDAMNSKSWENALMLLIGLGIRPVELMKLTVRFNPETGQDQIHCSHHKVTGKGSTPSRWLTPILPVGDDGKPVDWDLVELVKSKPELPDLTDASLLGQHLKRDTRLFRTWVEEAAENGEQLTPYAFRHSYATRGHRLLIPMPVMAKLMGHSEQTHCREYNLSDSGSMKAVLAMLQSR